MPKYNYKCSTCGKVTAIEASVHADKPTIIRCGCGADRQRVYLPTSFSTGEAGMSEGIPRA